MKESGQSKAARNWSRILTKLHNMNEKMNVDRLVHLTGKLICGLFAFAFICLLVCVYIIESYVHSNKEFIKYTVVIGGTIGTAFVAIVCNLYVIYTLWETKKRINSLRDNGQEPE